MGLPSYVIPLASKFNDANLKVIGPPRCLGKDGKRDNGDQRGDQE